MRWACHHTFEQRLNFMAGPAARIREVICTDLFNTKLSFFLLSAVLSYLSLVTGCVTGDPLLCSRSGSRNQRRHFWVPRDAIPIFAETLNAYALWHLVCVSAGNSRKLPSFRGRDDHRARDHFLRVLCPKSSASFYDSRATTSVSARSTSTFAMHISNELAVSNYYLISEDGFLSSYNILIVMWPVNAGSHFRYGTMNYKPIFNGLTDTVGHRGNRKYEVEVSNSTLVWMCISEARVHFMVIVPASHGLDHRPSPLSGSHIYYVFFHDGFLNHACKQDKMSLYETPQKSFQHSHDTFPFSCEASQHYIRAL